jgi:site-specific DNA-methyltransferase (adenine-specific)
VPCRCPSISQLRAYRLSASSLPKDTRKRKAGRSDSIRSIGFDRDHEWNVRWLEAARRILKPDATLWVSGTHHIIFSLGFALQSLGFRIIT